MFILNIISRCKKKICIAKNIGTEPSSIWEQKPLSVVYGSLWHAVKRRDLLLEWLWLPFRGKKRKQGMNLLSWKPESVLILAYAHVGSSEVPSVSSDSQHRTSCPRYNEQFAGQPGLPTLDKGETENLAPRDAFAHLWFLLPVGSRKSGRLNCFLFFWVLLLLLFVFPSFSVCIKSAKALWCLFCIWLLRKLRTEIKM